jgi:excisionase family DNA binding protein
MPPSARTRQARAWLPISDAAKALGVSTSTLRAWAADGQVPHVRTAGGHRRFNPDALAEWIAERPEAATPREERSTHARPCPAAADVLLQRADRIAELANGVPGHRAAVDWVLVLSQALRTGRLADALARAEALGRAHGSAGSPAQAALQVAISMERAVDDALAEDPHDLSQEDRDHVAATIRRVVVRIADSWAAATPHGRAEAAPAA